MNVPRLIEVALPIREISAESVRDKSLRNGHISTLHLWFARRPLAASRAVVFASLVPDPDHPACPPAFREAVERHLKTHIPDVLRSYKRPKTKSSKVLVFHLDPDPYRPYEGQPDTLRNRLLMFIAKWSPESLAFERGEIGREPDSAYILDDRCLVKWETCCPTLKAGEKKGTPVFERNEQGKKVLWIAHELTRIANGGRPPIVLDPFAGGGSIPLEVSRVGGHPIANDYNPVAYLILWATCEFPQRYGVPGQRPAPQVSPPSSGLFKQEDTVEVPNVLAHDVEWYAKEIMRNAKERIARLYPVGEDKRPVIGYIWVRTAPCSNPSCRAEMPLISNLLIGNKPERKTALTLTVKGKEVTFGVARNKNITRTEGTMLNRGNCRCPVCQQPTPVKDLRQAGKDKRLGERLVAVIVEGDGGKDYRVPSKQDYAALAEADLMAASLEAPGEVILPEITLKETEDDDISNSTGIRVHLYGFTTWGSLFNRRQLIAVQTLIDSLREVISGLPTTEPGGLGQAIACYLAMWIDKAIVRMTSFTRWHYSEEKFEQPFDMGKVSMVWDYAEANPFNHGSGGCEGQLDYVIRFIEHEPLSGDKGHTSVRVLFGDAAALLEKTASVDCVVTDPPYFDMYAYADLSDMFYTWLKRALKDVFPDKFVTPQTPKALEATALAHRHGGDMRRAEKHFTDKLADCFKQVTRICKPDGVVSVIFAHQTTKAWTALVSALFDAKLNITATFPIDTELKNRSRGRQSSALESSITVVCRPRVVTAPGSFKEVRRDIERVVKESVHRFWGYGFRGADLIVACYGPAVGEFGRYERVERGDGTPVIVPELLQLVREAALKAIAGEFTGDPLSRLYFVWANLYGTAEQPWDDVRLVVQIGGESEDAMVVATGRGLFVVDGANSRLAILADRADRPHLGDDKSDPLIDQLHRAMLFWKDEDRAGLVKYLQGHDLGDHTGFWRLAQALFEVMPRDAEDWKLVNALLGERNTLRTEIKRRDAALTGGNAGLFGGQDEE